MSEKKLSTNLTDAELEEAKELDQRFVDAMNRKDLEAAMDCFLDSPDLTLVLKGKEYRGTEQAREAIQELFDQSESINLTVEEISHITSGDGVIGVGKAVYRIKPVNGEPTLMVERWSDLRRKVDGRWVYIIDHATEITE